MTAGVFAFEAVTKTYPPNVRALRGVTVGIRSGEVTALLGANGAGKSTLARLMTGVEQPSSGRLLIDDKPVRFSRPSDAHRMGIAAVHQELPLLPNLTALENMTLGQTTQGFLSIWTSGAARKTYLDHALGLPNPPPPQALIGRLTVAERQKVAFIRALSTGPRVLIVDEGTSSLSNEERQEMQTVLRNLAHKRGLAVVYITHFIADALSGADRILALRDGELALDRAADTTRHTDVLEILGGIKRRNAVHEASDAAARAPAGASGLTVETLRCDGVRALSFKVSAGEVLGIYGPPGCGATEALRAIAGLLSHTGDLLWNGVSLSRASTPERVRRNVVYCNGDRGKNLILRWTVARNIGLITLFRRPLLALAAEGRASIVARRIIKDFGVKGTAEEVIRNLSGGNQQKVAVARALSLGVPLLLLGDDLTRGVDVVGRSHIHLLLREAAARGAAILLYSTDPEELEALSDRVLILRDGVIVEQLRRPDINVASLEGEVQRQRHVLS